jgi:quinol monooxygenase YgiN
MSPPIVVVARVRAVKGKGDALAAFLVEQSATVRKVEPGCLEYTPHRSQEDPELFLFYEKYRDAAAFEAHRTSSHMADYRKRREAQGLTEGPAEVQVFIAL